MTEWKDVPEEFLNEYLMLKAELKLEKIEHGKPQSYIIELEETDKRLRKTNTSMVGQIKSLNSQIHDLNSTNIEKKRTIGQLNNELSQLKTKLQNYGKFK